MDLSPLQIDRSTSSPKAAGRRKNRGGFGGLLVAAVVVFLLWFFRAPIVAFADRLRLPEVETAAAVVSSPLAAGALEGTAANGYIVADRRAALSADTPGRIVELNVREGSFVKKGEVVARLYADEYRAALARAEAEVIAQTKSIERAERDAEVAGTEVQHQQSLVAAATAALAEADATLTQATRKRERAEKMVADDVESRQWLDDARAEHERATAARASAAAQVDAATIAAHQIEQRVAAAAAAVAEARAHLPALEASRDQAKATLEKTEVRAPFTGVVVLKDAEVGEVVSPNAQGAQSRGSVATMVDFASLEVEVEMPERNITAVTVGAPVRIFLDAFPDQPYSGKVERVWPVANRQKATIEVRARFDQLDEKLRPEMGVRVVFLPKGGGTPVEAEDAKARAGVLIPAACVVRSDGKAGVFVLERDVARFRDVTLGEERGGKVFVERGLAGGESLVMNPPSSLGDGDRVRRKE